MRVSRSKLSDSIKDGIRGSGGGGGGSSSKAPTEAPDSLHSVALARIQDLVSEGEILGWHHGPGAFQQDIYLNGTPLGNVDGSLNFTNVVVDSRTGTQTQTYMTGFPDVESETSVGLELTDTIPWIGTITNTQDSAVRIRLSVPALAQTNTSTGSVSGYTIAYAIDVATDGGSYVTALTTAFTGKTTSKFERSHRIDLPPATHQWQVRVRRTTPNKHLSTYADTTTVESYTEIIDGKFTYPNSAYVGISVDAAQFPSIPTRAYDLYGRIVQIPSNYNSTTRAYTGTWDGTFKLGWTNNPAWVFYDLVLHPRYGLGARVSAAMVNKWTLYQIAQYCDQLVPDNLGGGGMEPRMQCNLYIQTRRDAYQVLSDLTSIFRGMAYWAAGAVQVSADMPGNPAYVYNQANVIDGKFTYAGSSKKTRFTTALVTWNNPSNFFKQETCYVPDRDGIARYGIVPTTLVAIGATTRGQAQRAGLWALLTSRLETETVTFKVGEDGNIAAPGMLIRIADSARAGARQGGRIHSGTTSVITVDTPAPHGTTGDSITCNMPDGISQTRTIQSVVGSVITVTSPFTELPAAEAQWVIETALLNCPQYRVISVQDSGGTDSLEFTITALEHNASKFNAIDLGMPITTPPTIERPPNVMAAPTTVVLDSYETAGQVNTSTVMTVTWSPVAGANGYNVQYQRSSGEWIELPTQYGCTVDIPNVQPGTYIAQVRAISSASLFSQAGVSPSFVIADQTTQSATMTSLAAASAAASAAAATAAAEATAAQSSADSANAEIANITSDNILSKGEKSAVIADYNAITGEQAGIDAEATAYGITTAKTAYDNAVTALTTYLTGLSPSWSNTAVDTPIVGATFRTEFTTVYTARQALLNAIYAAAQALANTGITNAATAQTAANAAQSAATAAQTSANTANSAIGNIVSDNMLAKGEKSIIIRDYNVLIAEQPGIDAQATAYGITTTKTNYDNSITALTTYLAGLSPSWSDVTQDTPITGTAFRTEFATAYQNRQALLNAIYAAAQALANTAQNAANTANTNANTANTSVNNLNAVNLSFAQGMYGWTPVSDAANWYAETGANGPGGAGTYVVHKVSTVTTQMINQTRVPVVGGQVIKATGQCRAIGSPNGGAALFIEWIDINGNIISTPNSNLALASSGTFQLALTATAPSNAAFANIGPSAGSTTGSATGYWTFANFAWNYQPSSVDEIPDGATYIRSIQLASSSSALTLDNATFQMPSASVATIPGWSTSSAGASAYLQSSGPSPSVGGQYVVLHSGAGGGAVLVHNRSFAVNPGDKVSTGGLLYAASGSALIAANFYNAAGTFISAISVATSSAAWLASSSSGVVPSNAATMVVSCNQATASSYAVFNYVWCSINDVRVAGSGAQIGDQRNLKQRTVTNIPAKVGTTISYTAAAGSPATSTISVGAFTVLAGSVSVAYNASSASVTGSNGATVTYYLYMNDPAFAGGTQTLIATTNGNDVYGGDGYVYVGPVSVTFPTSGSGSGGGGGGGAGACVCDDMWIDDEMQAGEARVGELFDCLDIPTSGLRKFRRRLRSTESVEVPCVRIATEYGAILECSATTPFDLPGGGMTYAPDMEGLQVVTDKGIETVACVIDIGVRRVCKHNLGGISFAAGVDPSHRIYSHNFAKP